MSFDGAVAAMITSLKNNKRPRKNIFNQLEKKATHYQLKQIRTRIQKENKKVSL